MNEKKNTKQIQFVPHTNSLHGYKLQFPSVCNSFFKHFGELFLKHAFISISSFLLFHVIWQRRATNKLCVWCIMCRCKKNRDSSPTDPHKTNKSNLFLFIPFHSIPCIPCVQMTVRYYWYCVSCLVFSCHVMSTQSTVFSFKFRYWIEKKDEKKSKISITIHWILELVWGFKMPGIVNSSSFHLHIVYGFSISINK